MQQTRDDLTALETDINSRFPRSYVLTGLENSRGTGLLATYQRELTLARAPLILFISLVVVVILYFLALAVGLLAGARSAESSMLRSRGASIGQVGGLLAVGEGLIVVAATLIGPLLAWGIGSLLLVETINPAARAGAGEAPLDVSLSWQMYAMGAVGGLLSLAVLTVAGGSLARLGILDFLRARARPPSAPWLQRYYIDIIAVVALAVLVWQIRQRGGFVESELTGTGARVGPVVAVGAVCGAVDPCLPAAEGALPWLMTGTAWVSSSGAGVDEPVVAQDGASSASLRVIDRGSDPGGGARRVRGNLPDHAGPQRSRPGQPQRRGRHHPGRYQLHRSHRAGADQPA